MRIIIASPPKSGNTWIKNLLGEIYDLAQIVSPSDDDPDLLQNYIQEGLFPENSIMHEHYSPSAHFFEVADSISAQVITTIRNPYDSFVSLYYYVQNFSDLFPKSHALSVLLEKPIDHPDVLEYLSGVDNGFGAHIRLAYAWLISNRKRIVRYEDLHARTFEELKWITDEIRPVEDEKIRSAIRASSVSRMRKKNSDLQRHVRSASVGDWRNHLTDVHLEIFRSVYGERIQEMGYEVAAFSNNSSGSQSTITSEKN